MSNIQLYIASGAALVLAIYALSLPSCPTSNIKKDRSWVNILGLDAFVLFKQKKMAIFFLLCPENPQLGWGFSKAFSFG
ncbi:nucleoside H+ symporter family protein, partial [Yersinia pestis PY-89]